MSFFGGRKEQDKRMVKPNFFLSKLPFWTYIKKSAYSLFGAWSFLFIHIRITPRERPKSFGNELLKKSDNASWAMKLDHGMRPSSMV